MLLRATSQELGPTREEVLEAVVQRLDLSRKHAADAYALAEQHEANPRSVWGYVQGLTRLSQRTPWQDARFSARPSRQPPPRHGPLILVIVAVRAQPARPLLQLARPGLRPTVLPHATVVALAAASALRAQALNGGVCDARSDLSSRTTRRH